MSFFNEYPYRNLTDLNLDWLLNAIRTLRHDVDDFVTMNAIKYADPIDWDITKQYEKNTVVIDANTGVAYLSVAAVPAGVNITRPEYWTVIFDLSRFITAGVSNLADSYEANLTYTATVETVEGGWVMWNGTLYEALNDIHIGDRYVPDGNIKKTTVEEFVSRVVTAINTEVQNRIDADTALQTAIDNEATARQDADATLQDNIDAEAQARQDADTAEATARQDADTAEATARQDADTTLQDHINAEATARQEADTALQQNIDNVNDIIGHLSDLDTDAKDSIVSAINEVNSKVIGSYDTADIRNYGGVADGTTNCTAAFIACMAANNLVYMPNYNNHEYVLSGVTLTDGQSVIGDEGTTINTSAVNLFTIVGNNVEIKNLIVNTTNKVFYINSAAKALSFIHIENIYSYGANVFLYDNADATHSYTNLYVNRCAARRHQSYGVDLNKGLAFIFLENVTVDSVGVTGVDPMFRFKGNAGCHLTHCEAEGGLSDGTHATHAGFSFIDCQAVWLERCMADTVDGSGFNFSNTQYVYMVSCVASLMGAHGIAILSTTCRHFLISNCYVGGRKGLTPSVAGAHGIYNYNDYILIDNVDITNMTGYAVADNAAGAHNQYRGLTISECDRSFVSASGGGIIDGLVSSVADVPTFGDYYHRLCVANSVLYDSPLGA